MTLIQFLVAVPVALLGIALFHDFLAGLGEDRIWGPPFPEDNELPASLAVVDSPCPDAAPAQDQVAPAPGALKPAC